MNFSVSEDIKNDPKLGPRVNRASQILEQIVGPTANLVDARWSHMPDARGRLPLVLALSDFTGAHVEERFEPDELVREGHLHNKFYRIWGDLLQDRSHKQLELLQSGE